MNVVSYVLASFGSSVAVVSGGAGGPGGGSGGSIGGSPVVPSAKAIDGVPKNGAPHARNTAKRQNQITVLWLLRLIFYLVLGLGIT